MAYGVNYFLSRSYYVARLITYYLLEFLKESNLFIRPIIYTLNPRNSQTNIIYPADQPDHLSNSNLPQKTASKKHYKIYKMKQNFFFLVYSSHFLNTFLKYLMSSLRFSLCEKCEFYFLLHAVEPVKYKKRIWKTSL